VLSTGASPHDPFLDIKIRETIMNDDVLTSFETASSPQPKTGPADESKHDARLLRIFGAAAAVILVPTVLAAMRAHNLILAEEAFEKAGSNIFVPSVAKDLFETITVAGSVMTAVLLGAAAEIAGKVYSRAARQPRFTSSLVLSGNAAVPAPGGSGD
jgi:hypothetical protein